MSGDGATAEPSRAEVLGWLARTGGSASEAAKHFWPNASTDERERIAGRIRKWAQRARERAPQAERPALRVLGRDEAPPVAREPETLEAVEDLTALTATEQARWQLLELTRLYKRASKRNDTRSVVMLDQRISALRSELEDARKREGVGAAPLSPSPSRVALDLVNADRQIAELAALAQLLTQTTEGTTQ